MTIPRFFGNFRGMHGYANANAEISSFFIAKESYFPSLTLIDWAVSDAGQFPIIIKQLMEVFICDRREILNRLYAQAAVSLNEVFHVHS
ncbi:hypothetical protein LC593_23735 [Nostoc sp. CHAB 5844]|nr:hypothetical protein [Nostoc sp. CHAB 5844]